MLIDDAELKADGAALARLQVCGCKSTEQGLVTAEVEITVGHRTFSVYIAQMAKLSCVCADIMSGHSLEQ